MKEEIFCGLAISVDIRLSNLYNNTMSNATKPTRIEKIQKQIATRLKKVEKALPAAWEAATAVGHTPEALESKSNWRFEGTELHTLYRNLEGNGRSAIYTYCDLASDLRRSLRDLEDAMFCEAKRQAAADAKAQKEADEVGLRMVCQICGRGILSNTGSVAHHGYERPGMGYQTDSCPGARHLPIEADTAVLAEHIENQIKYLEGMYTRLADINAEAVSYGVEYQVYNRNTYKYDVKCVYVNRENFDAKKAETPEAFGYRKNTFEEVKSMAIAKQEHAIRGQESYITFQQGRLDTALKAGVTHRYDGTVRRWVEAK